MDLTFEQNGVKILILNGPYVEAGRATSRAVEDYEALISRMEELKGFAADRLLALYNTNWEDEEIGTVDREGFMKRLHTPAIHLYYELGVAVVYFEGGGLFAGHWIEVHVDDGVPSHAGIVG
jgi:hypothetical protein